MQPVTLKGVRTLFSDGAQEAEKVLPELVTEDSRNGYKAVRYNMLPLMTLQGMKGQQDQIKTLQAENSNLKARLERLERMIGSRQGFSAAPVCRGR